MPGRIAFVPPRYGAGVVGGSEALSREIAIGLAGRGWDVEVLTTCAVDHYTWANQLPPGATHEDGLVVRRFEIVHHPWRITREVQLAIEAKQPSTLEKQLNWLSGRFAVPDLFLYLLVHGAEYDHVVFSPYLFWTTTVCMPLVADRAVVIPCLHDEEYARLDVVRPVLRDPRRVWFLSEPEHQVAHQLGPVAENHLVTGAGIDPPLSYDADGFRQKYGISRPFALYAGRRESDKGWDWLLSTFAEAVRISGVDLDLVTIGVGDVIVPPELSSRVIDLGFLSDQDRDDAFAAATVYLQPSMMESFSRCVMEAWLAGTPVLATADGEVVVWHCERSGGGLTFHNAGDLSDELTAVCGSSEKAEAMAHRGREYVLREYSWPVVLDRMEAELESPAWQR